MTLPDERYRALRCGHQLLLDLLNPKLTPRVPKNIRVRALWVLRHYPDTYHLTKLLDKLPEDYAVTSAFVRIQDESKPV